MRLISDVVFLVLGNDPCNVPNLCQNGGTCTPVGTTDYSCTCTSGWTGDQCQTGACACWLGLCNGKKYGLSEVEIEFRSKSVQAPEDGQFNSKENWLSEVQIELMCATFSPKQVSFGHLRFWMSSMRTLKNPSNSILTQCDVHTKVFSADL